MTAAKVGTLSEFLLARIADDERLARQAMNDAHVSVGSGMAIGTTPLWELHDRWDEYRVLAECDAKRRIVELGRQVDYAGDYSQGQLDGWDDVLRLLALPYSDHPDFRDEWRP